MGVSVGARIGNYLILEFLGVGGMGEVFRARDVVLGREVALKTISGHLVATSDRVERFEREARMLASLNHPNVATIHGLEGQGRTRFLVMELVEGETLAARLSRGRLGWREARAIFLQIAEGLEAAHETAIVHRDLKPANIMITVEGKVKLLDFGLAKAFGPEVPEDLSSTSPTVTREASDTGVILGTAAYMSPEQARGRPVDKRTDVWAFGCCLYEALTGKPAFRGETLSDTIAAILVREPDWSAVPAPAQHALRRALRKNRRERIRDVGDLRILLEDSSETTDPPRTSKRLSRLVLVAVGCLAAAAPFALWTVAPERVSEERPLTRARLHLAEGKRLLQVSRTPSVAISPDGRHVAYVVEEEGLDSRLYLRSLSDSDARLVQGSSGAVAPFFSPDGRWLAFYANRSLRRAPVTGGAATILASVRSSYGAVWLPSGDIVFGPRTDGGLMRLHPESGATEVLTEPDRESREKGHRLPDVLPGERGILFTSSLIDIASFDDAKIHVLDLQTGVTKLLIEGGTCARYSPSGHIIYYHDGNLFAAPFDIETLGLTGTPILVETGISASNFSGAEFAIAKDGTLVFAPGNLAHRDRRVVWIDRAGRKERLNFVIPERVGLANVKLSPDDALLLVETGAATDQIWVYDFVRGAMSKLTLEWDNLEAVWSPDGRRVALASNRNGPENIYVVSVPPKGDFEQLTRSSHQQRPLSWSLDGKFLLYGESADLWLLRLDGDLVPEPLARTPFQELDARLSPNGRFVAYESNESGRWEVYLRALDDISSKLQVSAAGGRNPRWRRDGGEIFYWQDAQLMAVDVSERDRAVVLARPDLLFEDTSIRRWAYDVSTDGRFIAMDDSEVERAPTELEIVINWAEAVKRQAPPTR